MSLKEYSQSNPGYLSDIYSSSWFVNVNTGRLAVTEVPQRRSHSQPELRVEVETEAVIFWKALKSG